MGRDGQGEAEDGLLWRLALGAQLASVGEHDVLGDGEAEAGAARLARTGLVHAVEALEEARQVLGRNALAVVANVELDGASLLARAHLHTLSPGTVFQGVVHEVGEDLVDGVTV